MQTGGALPVSEGNGCGWGFVQKLGTKEDTSANDVAGKGSTLTLHFTKVSKCSESTWGTCLSFSME
jgi:hypothetical protein